MENKNNKVLYYVIAAVVIILVVVFLIMNKRIIPVANNIEQGTDQIVPEEDTSEGRVNATTPAAILSYAQALLKYKDARIQIGESCQAFPNNVTFKNNTSIMIDNRTAVSHALKVGSTFSIKGYGFKIVKLSSSTLPATWLMDCDKFQNIATILIQK